MIASVAILLALTAVTTYFVRVRAVPHRFSAKDTVVLAEFTNSTGEPAFDRVLKQAAAIQLEQSPFLNILSDDRVARTLRLMERPGAPLTPEVAREICLRNHTKAILTGSIANVGSHYLIGLRATDCQTGDTLASAQADAENRDQILHALEKAGNQLREELGESLALVRRFSKPLPEATTSSLEALRAYAEGAGITDWPDAIPRLQKAVRLDPDFARAYVALGTRYANSNELALANENLKKAYELRERASDRERIYIETVYYMVVTGEMEKANQSYRQLIQEYPDDGGALGNLGFNYALMGSYERAAELTQEALRLDPDFAIWNGNLEGDYLALGRLDDARAVFDKAVARGLDGIDLRLFRYYLAFLQNDKPMMQQQVNWAEAKPGLEDRLLSAESDTAAYYGRLATANAFSQRATESAQRNGSVETAAGWKANEALRRAEFGDTGGSRRAATQALLLSAGPSVKILAALALARSGEVVRAEKLANELNQQSGVNTMVQPYWLPSIRASLELNRGNPLRAIELLRASAGYELAETWQFQFGTMYPTYLRGLSYLRAHQASNAAAEFQRILDHRCVTANFSLASLAHLQLARAKAMSHDSSAARKTYQDFVALWKDADPDIPVLKQAGEEYERLR